MKLDEIVKELNQELDNMEKDESISKIAAYINESSILLQVLSITYSRFFFFSSIDSGMS